MRNLLFLLLLSAATGLSAQDPTDYSALSDRLADYARRSMDQDVPGLLDLTDPALFEVLPRELLAERLTAHSGDSPFTIRVTDYAIDHLGESIDYDGVRYAPVNCHHQLTYVLEPAAYADANLRHRLVRMLEKRHGAGRVTTSAATRTITATVATTLLAVRRGEAPWYFFEYRSDNVGLLDLILPAVVLERVVD